MSSFFIKVFALIFMVIDHAGYILFPEQFFLRVLGRLAFPLFAYQMAVGFSHTRNKEKHILKLLLFGILCQIPYNLLLSLYSNIIAPNIIFTFLISLLIIYVIEKLNFNITLKKYEFKFKNAFITTLLVTLLLGIGIYTKVDYSWFGILLTTMFYFTLNHKFYSIIFFFILLVFNYILEPTLFHLSEFISFLDIIVILLFNGKKGYQFSWVFYALYFLHTFPMLLIKYLT